MNDIFGKIISIFLVCGIFFGMPLVYMQERAKTAEQLFLITEATHFVDSVCNTGKIDRHSLRRFYDSLSGEHAIYAIELLHETGEYAYDEAEASYERVSLFYDETDIWDSIEKGQVYYFSRGDFLRVNIRRIPEARYLLWKDQTVRVQYGGSVKYEAY